MEKVITKKEILGGIALLGFLWFLSQKNFLLFHSIAELFSIVIAYGIFMITWNLRHVIEEKLFIFLGIAYFFIASLDVLHTLSYKGFNVFGNEGANLPTQLWIAARYVESGSLLTAIFFKSKNVPSKKVWTIYAIIFSLILTVIFNGSFPDCYVEGKGLTTYKIVSEYVICGILMITIYTMFLYHEKFENSILTYMVLAIVFTVIAELAFTFYVSVYGISNVLGHLCKMISYYLICKMGIKEILLKTLHVEMKV